MSSKQIWLPTSQTTTNTSSSSQPLENLSAVSSEGKPSSQHPKRNHHSKRRGEKSNNHNNYPRKSNEANSEGNSVSKDLAYEDDKLVNSTNIKTKYLKKASTKSLSTSSTSSSITSSSPSANEVQTSSIDEDEEVPLERHKKHSHHGNKNSKEEEKDKDKEKLKSLNGQSILAADIIERLNSDSYECMICCDTIKRRVAVWSCTNCYHLFHLYCIKKWSKNSDESSTEKENKSLSWRCPGCQYIFVGKAVPKCYCGKVSDPAFNPYLLPHSCGEICGKQRQGDCPHPCTIQCHPGHCPPCATLGPLKTCFCGKLQYRSRCGMKDQGKSCGEICNKKLNCGIHLCQEVCHKGECQPCKIIVNQSCYCGKLKEDRLCGSGKLDETFTGHRTFSCNELCNRPLTCAKHRCPKKCHPGTCGECTLQPKFVTTCACGKLPLSLIFTKERTLCTDPIPTCPNLCEKMLECGFHKCSQKCHIGACLPCNQEMKVPCKCHSTYTTISCANYSPKNPILCNKICKTTRNCGRHPCGLKCCGSSPLADPNGIDPEGVHICNLICGKKLKCGKHKCDLLCHAGKCPPCHTTSHEPYICECGQTRLDPPILCQTKLPECPHQCVRPRPCKHASGHLCHSRTEPCPPCVTLTEKVCVGGHDIKKHVPCYLNEVSCGRLCGQPLSCGQHLCKRTCHGDPCQSNLDNVSKDELVSCNQVCGKKLTLCEHTCHAACHPNKTCPKIPCKQLVLIYCTCKRRSIEVECMRGGEDDNANRGKRELLCDEQCELEERNRKLALAFGINQPVNMTNGIPTTYSAELMDLAKSNLQFVQKLEKKFEEVIKGPSGKHSFPPMDRTQRRLIHELAKFYNLDTESYDKEPSRNVIITKRRDSRIPIQLLSKAMIDHAKAVTSQSQLQLQTQPLVQPQPHPQPRVPSPPLTESYSLQICDLTPDVKTHHLNTFLRPFDGQYQLKWLDDFNCLVLFKDYNTMKSALFILPGLGQFKIKEHKDQFVDFVDNELVEKPKIAKEKQAIPLEYKPPKEPWREDNNYFAALTKPTTTQTVTTSETMPVVAAKTEGNDMSVEKSMVFSPESTQFSVPKDQALNLNASYDDWEERPISEDL